VARARLGNIWSTRMMLMMILAHHFEEGDTCRNKTQEQRHSRTRQHQRCISRHHRRFPHRHQRVHATRRAQQPRAPPCACLPLRCEGMELMRISWKIRQTASRRPWLKTPGRNGCDRQKVVRKRYCHQIHHCINVSPKEMSNWRIDGHSITHRHCHEQQENSGCQCQHRYRRHHHLLTCSMTACFSSGDTSIKFFAIATAHPLAAPIDKTM
jgi:hypothetical protein